MKTFEKIYKVVAQIPKGKVSTYGQVAKLSGVKNPRVVGFALHVNKDAKRIPCHRVVKSDGHLASGYAFGGKKIQRKLLQNEGIVFTNEETIDLKAALFRKNFKLFL